MCPAAALTSRTLSSRCSETITSSPRERHLRPDQPGVAALRDQRHAVLVGPAAERLHLRHIGRPRHRHRRHVKALPRLVEVRAPSAPASPITALVAQQRRQARR